MLIVTTETITGKTLQPLGMVSGSMVQSKNAFKDIGANFRNVSQSMLYLSSDVKKESPRTDL